MKRVRVVTKKVMTRFGVVEMPSDRDPETIEAEDFFLDPSLKLIPLAELPAPLRAFVQSTNPEPLPDLDPKPRLTPTQLLFLQVIDELERRGEPFGWDAVLYHRSRIQHLRHVPLTVKALVEKGLLVEGSPQLTLLGHQRLEAQDVKEEFEALMDCTPYELEKIEPNGVNPDYDKIFIRENHRTRCYYRHECRVIRPRTKTVYLKRPEQ